MLTGRTVAVIVMPDAPSTVVNTISKAVTDSGGVLTHTVKINRDAFDPTKAAAVTKAIAPFNSELQLTDTMSNGTRLGLALGRTIFGKQASPRDEVSLNLADSLKGAGLIEVAGKSTEQAELAVVVTDKTSDPRPTMELLNDHVQMDIALKQHAAGVVLAGPNSDSIDGTDVLTARNDQDAVDVLSTVDVADLASGVATTIMAGKEQLLGHQAGHYGALTKADAPLPQLPVR
jgi:hypothetical protein